MLDPMLSEPPDDPREFCPRHPGCAISPTLPCEECHGPGAEPVLDGPTDDRDALGRLIVDYGAEDIVSAVRSVANHWTLAATAMSCPVVPAGATEAEARAISSEWRWALGELREVAAAVESLGAALFAGSGGLHGDSPRVAAHMLVGQLAEAMMRREALNARLSSCRERIAAEAAAALEPVGAAS